MLVDGRAILISHAKEVFPHKLKKPGDGRRPTSFEGFHTALSLSILSQLLKPRPVSWIVLADRAVELVLLTAVVASAGIPYPAL